MTDYHDVLGEPHVSRLVDQLEQLELAQVAAADQEVVFPVRGGHHRNGLFPVDGRIDVIETKPVDGYVSFYQLEGARFDQHYSYAAHDDSPLIKLCLSFGQQGAVPRDHGAENTDCFLVIRNCIYFRIFHI
ncbi:hypothetical protein [Zestomonas carbonaria]|uniref:hypothetical protein n=1 Tax=Zestomonas carbonaria TaxID=2762745 RepID=UPI001656EA03|nr:hypothetical protein [Pseudomonas carbonaria]